MFVILFRKMGDMFLSKKMGIFIMIVILLCTGMGCQDNNDYGKKPKGTTSPSATIKSPIASPNPGNITKPIESIKPTESVKPTESNKTNKKQIVIVIDAGHQAKQNKELEPIGPNASETKKKVTSGTRGCKTGLYEYKLNLMVAKKLQNQLESEGFKVIMTRTKDEVNISNAERAEIANNANADALIRIHANGSNNSSTNGVMTICNTPKNPYNADIYSECKKLSSCVLTSILETTKANSKGVWETDTMTGINWSKVPTTIIEMGYMSNPKEDERLSTAEYQDKIVEGICNGINQYFK